MIVLKFTVYEWNTYLFIDSLYFACIPAEPVFKFLFVKLSNIKNVISQASKNKQEKENEQNKREQFRLAVILINIIKYIRLYFCV